MCSSAARWSFFFFFNDTATTEIYTLSLHDALPISVPADERRERAEPGRRPRRAARARAADELVHDRREDEGRERVADRSEEHTSELQSRQYLVCRLLLEKKKKNHSHQSHKIPFNLT